MKRRMINSSSLIVKKLKTDSGKTANTFDKTAKLFSSNKFYILPAHFAKGRLKIFQDHIKNYGGELIDKLQIDKHISYIIVEETINEEKFRKIVDISSLNNAWSAPIIVSCKWLSKCIKEKILVDHNDYVVCKLGKKDNDVVINNKLSEDDEDISLPGTSSENYASPVKDYITTKIKETNYENPSNSEINDIQVNAENKSGVGDLTVAKFQSKFACAHSSNSSSKLSSPNSHITAELKKLLEVYQSKNDIWRVVGYQKAIAAIQNYPQKITSYEMALNIHGVGQKLAAKVWEIVNSGKLRKVDEICGSEETKIITKFLGVWGAGPTTANAWYSQGYKTIEDLKNCSTLTRHQKVGIRLYEDLNDRIPRGEVIEIHKYVSSYCAEVKQGLIIEVCGSYRRGRQTCGDVDVLITHPDGHSHAAVFMPLLNLMRKNGFLTDDLVTQEDNGNQQKYLGVCKLPQPEQKHRRLDIIVIPYSEFAPALMYFTGSAHFNRSMRLLAIKLGMSLSEHGLRKNIVRQGTSKLSDGVLLYTPTEESIFEHLGLPYRTPNERDL